MPCDVDVPSDNLFEISGDSSVGQKVVGNFRRQIDKEVHIAVGASFIPCRRAEHGDMNDAAAAFVTFRVTQEPTTWL